MIERHFDYILVIPSIPAGESRLSIPLEIQTDAPFRLCGRGLRVTPPVSTRSQAQVREVRFRYTNEVGNFLAQQPIQSMADFNFAYGQSGVFKPVWPQRTYPPGATISVDVINDSATAITNLQVMFRGKKLYRDGALPNPTYPPNGRGRDFTYQCGKGTPTDAAIVMDVTSAIRQIPLSILADADFVLRAGQLGLSTYDGGGGLYSTIGYTELYVQLFDSDLRPYSNIPIHVDSLFGSAEGTGMTGSLDTSLGNAAPGLLVPEIYLPKNSVLFFNLIRNDAAYTGVADALPVKLNIAWVGQKVYA